MHCRISGGRFRASVDGLRHERHRRGDGGENSRYPRGLWAAHGIFGTGRDMDEAFGLIETVEKAAEIYIKIMNTPWKQSITDAELAALCEEFKLTPREGYLDL